MFFRHIRPHKRQRGGNHGVGQCGEFVGEGFNRPQAGQILHRQTEQLGVLEMAQDVHLRFGVVFAVVEAV